MQTCLFLLLFFGYFAAPLVLSNMEPSASWRTLLLFFKKKYWLPRFSATRLPSSPQRTLFLSNILRAVNKFAGLS